MHRSDDSVLGFTVRIDPVPWVSERDYRRFLRALEDYASEHDLALQGTQLVWVVWSDERPVTESDQVDLLDWMVGHMRVVAEAMVTPLTDRLDSPAPVTDGYVALRPSDLATAFVSQLYRTGRLTPAMVIHALGGFVQPVVH